MPAVSSACLDMTEDDPILDLSLLSLLPSLMKRPLRLSLEKPPSEQSLGAGSEAQEPPAHPDAMTMCLWEFKCCFLCMQGLTKSWRPRRMIFRVIFTSFRPEEAGVVGASAAWGSGASGYQGAPPAKGRPG